jgi:hypothetical protein
VAWVGLLEGNLRERIEALPRGARRRQARAGKYGQAG